MLRSKLIIGLTCILLAHATLAGTETELIAAQAPEDMVQLNKTLDRTRNTAADIEQQLRAKGVTQFAMIRFAPWAYREEIWVLYRTEEKAFVTEFTVENARARLRSLVEVEPAVWDQAFNTFVVARQKRPAAPLPIGARMRREPWTQGYSGIVNFDKDGEARTYLLATDDLLILHIQSPVEELLCSTVFAGMHCYNGSTTTDGWVKQQLDGLMQHSQKTTRKLIQLTTGNQ